MIARTKPLVDYYEASRINLNCFLSVRYRQSPDADRAYSYDHRSQTLECRMLFPVSGDPEQCVVFWAPQCPLERLNRIHEAQLIYED